MKTKLTVLISLLLSLSMLAGGLVCAAETAGSQQNEEAPAANEETSALQLPDLLSGTGELTKDETVYVISKADGSPEKLIVSDHIVNPAGEAEINDISALTGITVVKGDAESKDGGDGKLTWKTGGGDVYYQGTTDSELPVKVSVSYKLNGAAISPEELVGRSGKVTIRFDYENTAYTQKTLGGRERRVYVPFAAVTGLLLDNEVFSGVTVTNGRAINDGSRCAVVGVALPGMAETLGLKDGVVDLPDYLEITANAVDFKMGMTLTLVTDSLFDKIDTDKFEKLDSIGDSVGQLTDAVAQLLDGSGKLRDGLEELNGKTAELVSGVGKLAAGTAALKSGASDLSTGASQLNEGAAALSGGLDALSSNSAALNDGALQVFAGLLDTAYSQLKEAGVDLPKLTVSNYAKTLNGVISSLDGSAVYEKALAQVTAAVEEKRDYITSQVTAAVRAEVEKAVAEAVRAEVGTKVTAAVKAEVAAKVTEAVKAEVAAKVAAAVKAEVAAKVVAAVKADVAAKVTETVRGSVAEKVILQATGMDKATYDAAVAAGKIDAATQAGINAAIDGQMKTDEVKAAIDANTEAQMKTDEVKAAIDANVEAQMKTDEVKAAIDANVEAQLKTDDVKAAIDANVEAQMKTDEVKTAIETNTEAQMKTDEVKAAIENNTEAQMKTDDVKAAVAANVKAQVAKAISDAMAGDEVQAKLAEASEGAKKVIALKTSLDGYASFYSGLTAYTAGVDAAAKGAKELKSGASALAAGASKLASGAKELDDGVSELNGNMPALSEGVEKLYKGASALADGVSEFNSKGISKLTDLLNGDIQNVADAAKAAIEAAKDYVNFSGISDGMDGAVKFIYRTAEIG